MNWFVTKDRAINLANVTEVVMSSDGKLMASVFFNGDDCTAHLLDDDAARLWALVTGGEPRPTEADRRAAVDEFRRLTGDAGHASAPTPVEALGEPPAVLEPSHAL